MFRTHGEGLGVLQQQEMALKPVGATCSTKPMQHRHGHEEGCFRQHDLARKLRRIFDLMRPRAKYDRAPKPIARRTRRCI